MNHATMKRLFGKISKISEYCSQNNTKNNNLIFFKMIIKN